MTSISRNWLARLLSVAALAFMPASASAQQIACPGIHVPIDVSLGAAPFLHMQLAGHDGMFELQTRGRANFVDKKIFGLATDKTVELSGSSLPTFDGGSFRPQDLGKLRAPGGRLAGIIGSDVLAQRVLEFHYDTQQPFVIISQQPCPEQQLRDAGFVPIAQHGYFGPAAQLASDAANTPMVFLRIGAVLAPARIDTSKFFLDNTKADVIDINEALLLQLRAAGIELEKAKPQQVGDCFGKLADFPRWLVTGTPFAIAAGDKQDVFTFGPPTLRARPFCGAPSNEPSAIIGALQMLRWGAVVVDGRNERVWLNPTRAAESAQPPSNAIALVWSDEGHYVMTTRPSLEAALNEASSLCNSKFGGCTPAVSVDNTTFACVSIARDTRNAGNLSAASNVSFVEGNRAVLATCATTYASTCKIERTFCND